MKNPLFMTVAVIILLIFALNMTTYQVDFTEKAVVSTLGKVSETGGVQEEPGLKFKLPAPLQTVTVYDRRSRFVEIVNEQLSLEDGSLVANAFLVWRVSDPQLFFRRFNRGGVGADPVRQFETAEDTLEQQLRAELSSVMGDYSVGDIFTTEPAASALPEIERRILERIEAITTEDGGEGVAIEVQMVGISRLVFPESISEEVIGRMAQFRQAVGARAVTAGDADASTIRSQAEADRRRIVNFAETLAARLRSEGEREAEQWYRQLDENPELAQFLASIDVWTERGIGRTLTLVLPLSSFAGEFFSAEYRERVAREGAARLRSMELGLDADEFGDEAGGSGAGSGGGGGGDGGAER